VQQAVLNGGAEQLTLADLGRIGRLQADQQQAAFDRLQGPRIGRKPSRRPGVIARKEPSTPTRVRGVLYFNAEMFLTERIRARQKLDSVMDFVRDLNGRLAAPNSRRTPASAHAEVDRELRKHCLLEVFRAEVLPGEGTAPRLRVELTLLADVWRDRRRWDGFCLLVGHRDLPHSAEELVSLFRAKDAVEKDFETIKSVVELRPVRHRTDSKVRAHVSLCILALLLQRTIELRLASSPEPLTAPAVFEELSTCHLNQVLLAEGRLPFYTVTRRSERQLNILRALRLESLNKEVASLKTYFPR
jgi:hypothetical protein